MIKAINMATWQQGQYDGCSAGERGGGHSAGG